jgi:hypothetical protein
MLTWYFLSVDTLRRRTNLWDYKIGQFLVSGGSAVVGFWVVWPFEMLKNLAQAENVDGGNTNASRARYIYKTQGILGFYRGIVPGS